MSCGPISTPLLLTKKTYNISSRINEWVGDFDWLVTKVLQSVIRLLYSRKCLWWLKLCGLRFFSDFAKFCLQKLNLQYDFNYSDLKSQILNFQTVLITLNHSILIPQSFSAIRYKMLRLNDQIWFPFIACTKVHSYWEGYQQL